MSRIIVPGKSAHPDFAYPQRFPSGLREIASEWQDAVAFASVTGLPQRCDAVTGTIATVTGTVASTPTLRGMASAASSTSATRLSWPGLTPVRTFNDGYSILILAQPIAVATVKRAFYLGSEAASAYAGLGVAFNANATYLANTGSFAALEYNSESKARGLSDTSAIDGNWHVYAINRPEGAAGPKFYVDGSSRTSSTTPLVGFAPTAGVHIHGQPFSTTGGCTDPIALVVVFRRALSVREIGDLGRDPWQIFKPANEPVYFIPAATTTTRVIVPGKSAHPDFAYPRRQPSAPLVLDRGNPLAGSFTHIWDFQGQDWPRNIVSGGSSLVNSTYSSLYLTLTASAVKNGARGLSADSQAGGYIGVTGNPLATSTCTYIWVESAATLDTNGSAIVSTRGAASTANESGALQIRLTTTGIQIIRAQQAVTLDATNCRTAGALNVGAVTVAGNSGRHAVFSNGRLVTSATPTTTYVHGTSALFNPNTLDALNFLGPMHLLMFVPRALPDEVVRALTLDPWQIFKPANEPVYFIPAAGAASVTGTLAATESGSDVAALAGDILVQGTLAVTETGADVASFVGSATTAPILTLATVVSITATTATPRVTITFAA